MTLQPDAQRAAASVLVVDLDDTLVRTDTLAEQFVALVFRKPLAALMVLPMLLRGRAAFKDRLSQLQPLDPAALPYNEPLLDFLRAERSQSRPIHLVTAAHQSVADAVAGHCGLFDSAEGSDAGRNLKGARKAEHLTERFPEGFCYAGDSRADLKVWARAESIVLAGASASVAQDARNLGKPLEAEFDRDRPRLKTWRKALRLHQWTKNLLVFLPLLLSQKFTEPHAVLLSLVAFVAMGLTASATYLINDLSDLASDRRHATKRNRPLAAGVLRIEHVAVAVPLLLITAAALALATSPILLLGLAGYAALTLTYTFRLKRRPMLDVAALASLYAIRVAIGAAVIGTPQSPWLITFSLFFFFSMSLAKRYAEIHNLRDGEGSRALPGRGYRTDDGPAVLALGAASSVASVLVVVTYLMEEAFPSNIYEQPDWLWVAPFLLMIWVGRIWLVAGRGELDEDPIAYAISDRFSWKLMVTLVAAFVLATVAWP
jgi:4-hydroxybenzoate polyprenyltransferase